MDRQIPENVCRAFGLGRPLECDSLGGTRNRNYLLRTESGKWFARLRYYGYADPERVAFDHGAIRFLCGLGVPVVQPRETATGETFANIAGDIWEVYPFVEARPFREGDISDAAVLGEAVGRFHSVGASFPRRFDKLGPRGETDPVVITRQMHEIEAQSPECALPLQQYRAWLAEAERALPDARYAGLRHTLVHGDLQPANLLMAEDRVAAFVDLDWCAWRPRVYDLAFALLFCCSTHETSIRGENIWSLTQPPRVERPLVDAFLNAYATSAVPLSNSEFAALRAQTVLSWCHSRVAGALKVPPADRAEFLARSPETLEALFPL